MILILFKNTQGHSYLKLSEIKTVFLKRSSRYPVFSQPLAEKKPLSLLQVRDKHIMHTGYGFKLKQAARLAG